MRIIFKNIGEVVIETDCMKHTDQNIGDRKQ